MTIKSYLDNITQQLTAVYPEVEAKEIAYRLFEFYLEMSKVQIMLDAQNEVSATADIDEAIVRLLANEPLQYILGEADFYDLKFKVDANVLIPRPETEELVQLIINESKGENVSILEIGTGSGCIPISLKKNLMEATVSACDISEGALAVAKSNAEYNSVDVDFFHCDILDVGGHPKKKFDIIVSNPPYICEQERVLMRKNVLDYEPDLALFVPDDNALMFYVAIADFAQSALNKAGRLYFEINEALGADTRIMLQEMGFIGVIIHQDVFGKDRMISASKA